MYVMTTQQFSVKVTASKKVTSISISKLSYIKYEVLVLLTLELILSISFLLIFIVLTLFCSQWGLLSIINGRFLQFAEMNLLVNYY